MSRFPKDGRPVLKGYVTKSGQLVVWCPYCRDWHFHGNVEGHRVAHCVDGPLKERGYYIQPFTKTELSKFGVKNEGGTRKSKG